MPLSQSVMQTSIRESGYPREDQEAFYTLCPALTINGQKVTGELLAQKYTESN